LDGEIFYSLKEAQIVIESWRRHYNAVRPHESLGYRPPAPEVFAPAFAAWPFCALGIRSDGHAHAGVETWAKLTFESEHLMGADHPSMPEPRHTRASPLTQAFAGFRFFCR